MLYAAGVIITILVSFATLASPFLGVLIYSAWVIVRPQEVWLGFGGSLPLERIIALTLLASLFLHRRLRPLGDLDRGRTAFALLIFLALNYLSILTSVWRGGALAASNDFAKTVVFFVCIIALIDDEVHLRKFLWVYALAIGWTAASSIWNFETHPYYAQGIQRAIALQSTQGDPNAVAATLTLALPILLVLFWTARGVRQALLLGVLASAVVCTILTGSRMGFIMLVLVLVLTAVRSARRAVLIPGLLCLLVVGWLAMPMEYRDRYETIVSFAGDPLHQGKTAQEASAYGRIVGFAVAWQMFADRPILGVGAGQFPTAWGAPWTPYNYHGRKAWFQPHNLPGQVMAELGLLGVLSFTGYVIAVWRELRAAKLAMSITSDPSPFLSGLIMAVSTQLVALLVEGLSGHNLYRLDWYAAGALAVVVCRLTSGNVPARGEAAEIGDAASGQSEAASGPSGESSLEPQLEASAQGLEPNAEGARQIQARRSREVGDPRTWHVRGTG